MPMLYGLEMEYGTNLSNVPVKSRARKPINVSSNSKERSHVLKQKKNTEKRKKSKKRKRTSPYSFLNSLITGLPVRPSHKFGFRSSAAKGRHEGLVPRNDVLTMVSHDFLLHGALAGYFLYLVSAPPEKPTRRCKPEEGYLRCSKRFDHRSHSIIFLLFEFKSVR